MQFPWHRWSPPFLQSRCGTDGPRCLLRVITKVLTRGGVIDDKKESTSDAHAVGIKEADAKKSSDGGVHGRTVPLQNIPENKSESVGRLNKLATCSAVSGNQGPLTCPLRNTSQHLQPQPPLNRSGPRRKACFWTPNP